MSSNVETIKDRLGIVDVVGQYVKLEKAGSNLKAKCPFHNEKTASFFVSPTRNTYYCFGCGTKGDIFTFVEQFEGLDFQGALKMLGEKAGVPIIHEKKEDRGEREELFSLLEMAALFFEDQLSKKKGVQEYLHKRGLTDKTTQEWRLGYAPSAWQALAEHLKKEGLAESKMESAGLVKKSERETGRHYDRFRDRIMFPIFDNSGRVIAFSGRIFTDDGKSANQSGLGQDSAGQVAKYINSPDTPLFHKSKVLYGIDRAKLSIRKFNFSIIVEGQMDLLASHQAGFTNTVAVSGTALTQDHINLLKRLSNNIVLAFDADSAGIASSGKGTTLALESGCDVKIASIPKGLDPADLILKDAGEWKKTIKNAKHIVDFYLDILSAEESDARKLLLKIHEIVLPYVVSIPNKIDQAYFVSKIAERLNIAQEAVWEEVNKVVVEKKQPLSKLQDVRRQAISAPDRKESLQRMIAGILLWQENSKRHDINGVSVKKRLENIVGGERYGEISNYTKEMKNELLFETERMYLSGGSDHEKVESDVDEMLMNLEEEYLKDEYNSAIFDLKNSEAENDKDRIIKALKHCKEVSDKLSAFAIKKTQDQK